MVMSEGDERGVPSFMPVITLKVMPLQKGEDKGGQGGVEVEGGLWPVGVRGRKGQMETAGRECMLSKASAWS
jgi:hypothetical protein